MNAAQIAAFQANSGLTPAEMATECGAVMARSWASVNVPLMPDPPQIGRNTSIIVGRNI